METKHFFVATLDVGELLPFSISKTDNINQLMEYQKKSRDELNKFIDVLSKKFNEPIWFMGTDIIEDKTYERFLFNHGGFLEIMLENPAALNAHFVWRDRADRFCNALKETLKTILPNNTATDLFINSIEAVDENSQNFTYNKWNQMRNIRV